MPDTPFPESIHPDPYHYPDGACRQINSFNWAATSLGTPAQWPQSLHTTLSILWGSPLPQLLFWGSDHLLFYNDAALRQSAGKLLPGPAATTLRQQSRQALEHWLEQVRSGEQAAIPAAYMSEIMGWEGVSGVNPFSYARVAGEQGTTAGVLVTAMLVFPEAGHSSRQGTPGRIRLLEAQIEALPNAVLVVDRKGGILSCNKQFATLWRIPQSIIDAADDTAALKFAMNQVADPEGFIARVQQCYESPDEAAHEDVPLRDGRILERHGNVVNEEAGAPLGYIWHFRDVTLVRRSEEQRRAAEERYQNFIRQSTEGIWRFEVDEPISAALPLDVQIDRCFRHAYLAECNNAMAKMYGFDKAEELIGTRLSDFFPRNQDSEDYFAYFLQSGYRVQELESKEIDRHGATRYFCNNLVGIQENGMLVRAWGTQRDITAQKMAAQQLRQNEEKYRSLFERMDQGFAIIEVLLDEHNLPVNYKFLETNPTFSRQTGLKDAMGKTVKELVPGIEQHWIDIYGQVALTGEPLRFTEGSEVMGRWFDVHAFRQGEAPSRQVALLFTDITERKKAEQQIRESEARFQNLVREASMGIILLTGAEMKVEIANRAYGTLIGRTPEELLGQELFAMIPEMEAAYRPILKKVLHSGEPHYLYDAPYKIKKGDHTIIGFLNLVYQPYRGNDGRISGVLALCQDVTESVQARKALEASEERFRSLANSMPQVVWIAGADGRVSYYNNRIETFSGALKQQDDTWIWQGVLHPEDLLPTEEAWNRSVATGAVYEKAHRIQMTDGSYRWHLSRAIPQLDDEGKPAKWYGTATDVHEQMLIQQELKLAKDQLELTFQSVPAALYLMNAAGKMIYVNQQGASAMGFASPEVLLSTDGLAQLHQHLTQNFEVRNEQGRPISDRESASAQTLETRQPARAVLNFINKQTGASTWYLSQSAPLFDESGNIVMVLTAATDITTQRAFTQQLEKEVADRTRELQRSNEDLQQFAHVASHDLKEPVRKVRTFASMLRQDYNSLLPERAQTYLSKIDASTERIYKMIDGVLLYSSMDARNEDYLPVNLNEVVRSIETDLEVVIAEMGATIRCADLPTIAGASALLYQLLYNLLGNALKFARTGVPPLIHISSETAPAELVGSKGLEAGNPYVLLTISDNGIGFAPDESERIFQTFSRLHAKDKYEGTGLGLSLCKKIVERHGGAIWAEGRPGAGARFLLLLPADARS